MLQEEKKKKCKNKVGILVVLVFLAINFPFLIFVAIFLFFAFGMDIKKLFQFFGIYDCFEESIDKLKNKYKESYNQKESDGTKAEIRGEKNFEKSFFNDVVEEKNNNYRSDNGTVNNNKVIKDRKKTVPQKKTLQSPSIWDDYESVIDIMNKRK